MEWFTVRKNPIQVRARGPVSTGETHEVHAGKLNASVGVFIIDDGAATYPIDPDIFYETYDVSTTPGQEDGWFTVTKKPTQVQVRGPIDSTETIRTLEGTVTASPGNYIIKGVDGETYPVEGDEFQRLYQ